MAARAAEDGTGRASAGNGAGHRPGYGAGRLRYWLATAALLLLAIAAFLPPLVNIERYQRQIADRLGSSLGRPVRLSGVSLRLLPRPGFEIRNFTVLEGAGFGAEPLLHANSVLASVGIASLWRGHLQISRLRFEEASVNLVRMPDGRWNLDSLLERGAALPVRPTGRHGLGGGAGYAEFPYIDASDTRINFMSGNTKLPFSLVNAEVALWLESPAEWRVRLRGQPVRTDLDLDLADTGEVRLEAGFNRAAPFSRVPASLKASWQQAQLGQFARLVVGQDAGWRGGFTLQTEITSAGATAAIAARLNAQGVHREEFAPHSPLDFDASCTASYQRRQDFLDRIVCDTPVGNGRVHVEGAVRRPTGGASIPRLEIALDEVPIQAMLDLFRTVRADLAPGVEASGALEGSLTYEDRLPAAGGDGGRTRSPGLSGSLRVPAAVFSGGALGGDPLRLEQALLTPSPDGSALLLAPLPVAAGGERPLRLGARLDRHGFSMRLEGTAGIPRLLEYSSAFGLLRPALSGLAARGTAELALSIEGPWLPALADPEHPRPEQHAEGTVTLSDASFRTPYLASPVRLGTATARLTAGDDSVSWSAPAFTFGPVTGAGIFQTTIGCGSCRSSFHLSFGTLEASDLRSALLGAGEHGALMGDLLARLGARPQSAPWPPMSGSVNATVLSVGGARLENFSASLDIHGSELSATQIGARMAGGFLAAEGSISADRNPPVYRLRAALEQADPQKTGSLLGRAWPANGSISAAADLTLAGYSGEDLRRSAAGTMQWTWTGGALSGPGIPAPLRSFARWSAAATVGQGLITLERSEATSFVAHVVDIRPVTGTITLAPQPEFRLASPPAAETASAPAK